MKKPVYKKWWFWVIVIIIVGAIGSNMGKETGQQSSGDNQPGNSSSASPTPSKAPETIEYSTELTSGHYTAGIDFPAGKYDIEAIEGGGNVMSSNAFSGGINAILGTADANKSVGINMYEQKYSNVSLSDGVTLSVTGVKVKISSDKASGEALTPREQEITETISLESGYFVAGEDFPEGIYDINALSGGGNVISDNMFDGGLNLIMGTEDANSSLGMEMYQQSFKNAEFKEGVSLQITGVKIELVPSK